MNCEYIIHQASPDVKSLTHIDSITKKFDPCYKTDISEIVSIFDIFTKYFRKNSIEFHNLKSILVNFYHLHNNELKKYITLPCKNSDLPRQRDAYGNPFKLSIDGLNKARKMLESEGYIEVAYAGFNFQNISRKARYAITPKFETILNTFANNDDKLSAWDRFVNRVYYASQNVFTTQPKPVVLRNDDKEEIIDYKFRTNKKIRSVENKIKVLNETLYSDIMLLFSFRRPAQHIYEELNKMVEDGKVNTVNIHNRYLQSIWKRSDGDKRIVGGRMYRHWVESLPSAMRVHLKFAKWTEPDEDGDMELFTPPSIELDYSNIHIALLYAKNHIQPPEGDLYAIKGWTSEQNSRWRRLLKFTMQAMLNATSEQSAVKAVYSRVGDIWPKLEQEYSEEAMAEITTDFLREVIAGLAATHAPIAHHMNSGVGALLQSTDAEIALEVVWRAWNDYGIPVVPIHDSMLFPFMLCGEESSKDIIYQLMSDVYGDIVGEIVPRITFDTSSIVLSLDHYRNSASDKSLL